MCGALCINVTNKPLVTGRWPLSLATRTTLGNCNMGLAWLGDHPPMHLDGWGNRVTTTQWHVDFTMVRATLKHNPIERALFACSCILQSSYRAWTWNNLWVMGDLENPNSVPSALVGVWNYFYFSRIRFLSLWEMFRRDFNILLFVQGTMSRPGTGVMSKSRFVGKNFCYYDDDNDDLNDHDDHWI